MKRALYLLLILFLIIDTVFAFSLFRPKAYQAFPFLMHDRSVEIVGNSLTRIPHLENISYLNKKLNEVDFWKHKNVNFFSRNIDKVTVNHLVFTLTDKPQRWGQQLENLKTGRVILSYGQRYDFSTQTMTIYIQTAPEFFSRQSVESTYTAAIMQSIYDLTYKYPKNQKEYSDGLVKFVSDLNQSSKEQTVVRFGLL